MGCAQSTLEFPPAHINVLKNVSVFQNLDDTDVIGLAKQITSRAYNEGETIFKAGDRGRMLYIIAEGKVDITVTDQLTGRQKLICTEETPGHFGEITLVNSDSVRSATATASKGGCTCLRLTIKGWEALRNQKWYKVTERRIRMVARHRLVSSLRKMKFLAGVDDPSVNMLGGIFNMVHFHMGEVILKEGEPPSGFYIVVEGDVDVSTDTGAKSKTITSGGEAPYFGEVALIEKIPISATVTASTQVLCLKITPGAFKNFLQIVPADVRHQIAKVVKQRANSMLSSKVADIVDPKNVALGPNMR